MCNQYKNYLKLLHPVLLNRDSYLGQSTVSSPTDLSVPWLQHRATHYPGLVSVPQLVRGLHHCLILSSFQEPSGVSSHRRDRLEDTSVLCIQAAARGAGLEAGFPMGAPEGAGAKGPPIPHQPCQVRPCCSLPFPELALEQQAISLACQLPEDRHIGRLGCEKQTSQ